MAINIVLDCKDPTNPVFVEIEDDFGKSISVGKRGKQKGFDTIRIDESDLNTSPQTARHSFKYITSVKYEASIYNGGEYKATKHIVEVDGKNYEIKQERATSNPKDGYKFFYLSVEVKEDYSVTSRNINFTTILLAVELVRFVRGAI